METFDPQIIIAPIFVIIADLFVYIIVGMWGKRSAGSGVKYQPFTGGEEFIPQRGVYRSDLFVFAALFLIVEVFALLFAGSFEAPSNTYPLLFLFGGSGVILVVTWWFMIVGGGNF
jgi:hypothetical protein